jgi:hypothetical protein
MTAKEKQDLLCHIMEGDYRVFGEKNYIGELQSYNITHPYLSAGFRFYLKFDCLYRHQQHIDYGAKISLNAKQNAALLAWCEENAK